MGTVRPNTPIWIRTDKEVIRSNEEITVSWGGATGNDIGNEIAYYSVQCRMYNGTTWTDWSNPDYTNEESYTFIPEKKLSALKKGDFLDIRVASFDNTNVQSASYRKIQKYIDVIGGGVRVYVNGAYKEGTPFAYIDGTWKQGVAYTMHNEEWKEGV